MTTTRVALGISGSLGTMSTGGAMLVPVAAQSSLRTNSILTLA
jgi:hypothetical protein